MTDKKTDELNEQELDQVTGGASIGDIKPGLTEELGKPDRLRIINRTL